METVITAITDIDLSDLIDFINDKYKFDFSGYSKASLKRRVARIMMLKRIGVDDLKRALLDDTVFFQWLLSEITVNVTEMFRDPTFYKALLTDVVPSLANYHHIKIWSAGCSSGEEVYSLLILLSEAGFKKKSSVLGTDINTDVLNEAREGAYSVRKIDSYAENYRSTGLSGSLTDHFEITGDKAVINREFKNNSMFLVHDLIPASPFQQFQLITCRNVFIYFDASLQEKILDLFYHSLSPFGFLCLGSKETIRFPGLKDRMKLINAKENIYQKIGGK